MDALRDIAERTRRTADRTAAWWGRQRSPARLCAAAVVLAVVLAGCDDGPAAVATPATPAATAVAATPAATATTAVVATPAATPAEAATPQETPTGTAAPGPDVPTYYTLESLHAAIGEAPDATLGRIRIPVIGVDAALGQRLVSGDTMQNPTGPGDVVWYDLSPWEGLGGEPGAGGNAVFSGHVDYLAKIPWADARYQGDGVFRDLSLLAAGDVIEIEIGGATLRYAVVWQRQVAADIGAEEILSADVEVDSITLITCSGDFNRVTSNYTDRLIVRAERIPT